MVNTKEKSLFATIVDGYLTKGENQAIAEALAREFIMYMDRT